MKKDLLHTPEGVRDIYSTECVEKKIIETSSTMYAVFTDITTSRHHLLNILMYLAKNEAVCLLMKCSSYSTDMAILLC